MRLVELVGLWDEERMVGERLKRMISWDGGDTLMIKAFWMDDG